jgi:hypothetical protein
MGPEPNKNWPADLTPPQHYDIEPIVATPYIIDTEKLFTKENIVKLACDTKGAEIHYTLDGSRPDKSSKLYKEPFKINKTTTVKMIAFRGNKASLPTQALISKTGMGRVVRLSEVKPGLHYKYTHGIYRMTNDFRNVQPLKHGILPTFTIEPKEKELFFSFAYEGYINIPKTGQYTFYVESNDGSRMFIDNYLLINNDGIHAVIEESKPIKLKAGLHAIQLNYFQEGGTNHLKVSWEGPGISKQEIPANVLFHK